MTTRRERKADKEMSRTVCKRYVTEFANDVMRSDAENDLMREDIKAARKGKIAEILFEYRGGYISSTEAVLQIAGV